MKKDGRSNSVEMLSARQRQMIDDDHLLDVTPEEVSSLLCRMARIPCSDEEILKVRKKYDALIDDRKKKLRVRLGLSIDDDHRIVARPTADRFLIDGFLEQEWKMLNCDNYIPCIQTILRVIKQLRYRGHIQEAERLEGKYHAELQEYEKSILRRHGLPENAEYSYLDKDSIDGLSFFEWKLLYLPGFSAAPSNITYTIRKLEMSGESEKAAAIYNRYADLLEEPSHEPELSFSEAQDVLRNFGIIG